MYNFTLLQNNTNFLELYEVMNTSSNEWLTLIIIIAAFLLPFIAMKSYETLTALRTSSFICAIIAVLFYILGQVSMIIVLYPIVILLFIIVYTIAKDD